MEVTGLTPNQWYCVTVSEACTITAKDGTGYTQTLKECSKAGQYMVKTISDKLNIDDDDHALVEGPFKVAPAGGLGGGEFDGHLDGNLYVGNGDEPAVAAVCTLTLGNLATGGTLTDSNGQSVTLDNPHKYATGTVSIPDTTAAGTLTIGEWSKTWEAKVSANATGYWPNEAGSWGVPPIQLRKLADPEDPAGDYEVLWEASTGFSSAEDFVSAFNSEQDFAEADITELEDTPFLITAKGDYAGGKGNSLVLCNPDGELYFTQLQGGQDARTAVDVFNDILADEDCPVDVTLDADELGLGFTAKVYGVNDEITITSGMFSDAVGMSGGHGDYSVAELVTAIGGGFDDITAAAGEAEGTITLTANTAGAAANAITYTATGCFGGGTVKQGSTTRGKNAVEQTDYEIILNGGATQPLDLASTEPLKNGHVYTLAVAAATDLSALSVKAFATCELWLDYSAGSVTWPTLWSWVDGIVPTFVANNRYFVHVWSDGVAVIAELKYSYVNV